MSYFKIGSYLATLVIGGVIASWYYGEEIEQMKSDAYSAKANLVEQAVKENNELSVEDRGQREKYFDNKIKNDTYFANLEQESKNVKTVTGCYVDPNVKRLWNLANRGNSKTLTFRTNGLHDTLQRSAAEIQAIDLSMSGLRDRGTWEPYFKRENLSQL